MTLNICFAPITSINYIIDFSYQTTTRICYLFVWQIYVTDFIRPIFNPLHNKIIETKIQHGFVYLTNAHDIHLFNFHRNYYGNGHVKFNLI